MHLHKKVLCAVVMSALCGAAIAEKSPSSNIQFDIPAQRITDALNEFAKQSGLQILIDWKDSKGVVSPRISGAFTVQAALEKLLTNSGLRYEYIDGRTISIRAVSTPPANKTTGNGSAAASLVVDSDGWLQLAEEKEALAADKAGSPEGGKTAQRQKKQSGDVEEMIVEESRVKPFSDSNVDAPRTINDEQPYYIFDAKTIERSGAVSVEDFLRTHLTMNAIVQTNGQDLGGNLGATSSINLRGLGLDKTLILINGRRAAGIAHLGADYQTDLNGIPMGAIERIEVLPSSASGIYGGGAIGGVVNVILKRDYSGGELRLAYDNTWKTDAPTRRLSGTFGHAFNEGKTTFMVTGQLSDAKPLRFGDRRELIDRGLQTMLRNSPSTFFSATNPFMGAMPNIVPNQSAVTSLVLKDGRSLNSRNTTVPVGTAPGTSRAALSDALFANAGQWNLTLPNTYHGPTGLLRPMSATPIAKSAVSTIRHQFGPSVEVFAELSHQTNHADTAFFGASTTFTVLRAAPTNPFDMDVRVRVPSYDKLDTQFSDSKNTTVTTGVQVKLPQEWLAQLDYSYTKNTYFLSHMNSDSALSRDVSNGVLDPFVDTQQYSLNLGRYLSRILSPSSNLLKSLALRGSGPLPALPWGVPYLTLGAEQRIGATPRYMRTVTYPITITESYNPIYLPRTQTTQALYAEAKIPLVAENAAPLLHALDLQFSGRSERYVVDAGTSEITVYPNNPSRNNNGYPTLNGLPFSAKDSYMSQNWTIGFKYQPLESFTVRASLATAFLPPVPSQLIKNPMPDSWMSTVLDPRNNYEEVDVATISGGNPNLKPQNSESWNAGLIWEPRMERLRGLRFNLEYYRIEQFDQIGDLGLQDILNAESVYPDRVTRDASGRLLMVDTSLANLFILRTEGMDLSFDYRLKTALGAFDMRVAQTHIMHEQRQSGYNLPLLEYAGYVGEGGPAKNKSNLSLGWEYRQFAVMWSTFYFGSYKQSGAAGGPSSMQSSTNRGGVVGNTVRAQGSQTIGSQMYHDLFLSYSFDRKATAAGAGMAGIGGKLLDGLSLQVGIKNILNTIPPFDAGRGTTYYVSPFGDSRLRNYWINVAKTF